ncbi:Stk1 family PASTA domain-containing Ser/Thr kinase [Corynebacterium appendicis]|uniref:Stk1 family PASTA domain-containing Ser/Thr kinase n=1 Tax=Corynebacterium appendicis TaxID=163202 RepID=UPI0021AECEA6|nr:Stk1 family PASTA domain-containing Ser/Thr kinase [Corynebacterium appendicis]MCT1684595.1 Stk1 family PASTA domain-containing Ser/Thr kinase [Corynebacterium appendicis]
MTLIGDRYQLGNSIGTGGMSDVYVATDTLLGREVAVKMLKIDMARDENFRQRFRKEAQNSARLNHPNIVAVYDTGETLVEGISIPYIVMEHVKGRDLRAIVREEGPLRPEKAAELLFPVTLALEASHESGIIHRDVKPANIMVTSTGEVKVMDFGIARALDDSTAAMTQTSAVIGTAQYLSPEQARGKSADARSDIYALGCVMYEVVTGTPPFEGETPFAVAYQHVQEDPEPPSARIADLSESEAVNVDSVILTAMAKHPADRYQSAFEMADDLERLEHGAVTEAARSHLDETELPDDAAPVAEQSRYEQHRQKTQKTGNTGMKILAILMAAVMLLGGGAFAFNKVRNDPEEEAANDMVFVPKVVGKKREEAVQELEKLGLLVTVNEAPHPDVPRGEVLSTNPTEGSQLQKGTPITVTVSSGREVTDVPDVSNLSPQDAAAELEKAGLKLDDDIKREHSDTVPEGVIMSQQPAAGSQLSKGSKVSVTVSNGREKVKVPSLEGMNVSQAESVLSSLGLESTTVEVDSLKPKDEVLAVAGQGEEVDRGTTIELRVSNGMLMTMPKLVRQNPQQAEATLRKEGWTGNLKTGHSVDTPDLNDHGLVAGHRPAEGEEIRKDADVTVDIWKNALREGVESFLPAP